MRKQGWRLRCIDAEMALHDAAITRFRQWWRRTRRSGHAFGEIAFLHPDVRDPDCRRSVRSIMVWGGAMPAFFLAAVVLALAVGPRWRVAVVLALVPWPLRMVQLARKQQRRGLSAKVAWVSGILLMIGKVPQLLGLIGYHRDRLSGRASRIIEHKSAEPA
jgi:hypothetical protein